MVFAQVLALIEAASLACWIKANTTPPSSQKKSITKHGLTDSCLFRPLFALRVSAKKWPKTVFRLNKNFGDSLRAGIIKTGVPLGQLKKKMSKSCSNINEVWEQLFFTLMSRLGPFFFHLPLRWCALEKRWGYTYYWKGGPGVEVNYKSIHHSMGYMGYKGYKEVFGLMIDNSQIDGQSSVDLWATHLRSDF